MNFTQNHSKGRQVYTQDSTAGTAKSSNKGLPGEAAHSALERRAQLSRG